MDRSPGTRTDSRNVTRIAALDDGSLQRCGGGDKFCVYRRGHANSANDRRILPCRIDTTLQADVFIPPRQVFILAVTAPWVPLILRPDFNFRSLD